MGRMKELFTEYQQQMSGSNADLIDDEYHFQKWVEDRENGWTEEMEQRYWAEQCPDPFATPEDLEAMNDSIKLKYSDWDITSVLGEVLGDGSDEFNEILIKLNNVYNIKNGYID